tara:strand:+ start:1876 stop:2916 length:1041 start_codon:yes stop_codon:yes gene_type:complete
VNFASDNVTGAAPEILQSLLIANEGDTPGYGGDELTLSVKSRLQETFETEAEIFLVATGTAANALAISAITPSHGSVLCHWTSHIYEDECGAPEFFSGGARLIPVDGLRGKMCPIDLTQKAANGRGDVHMLQPSAASVTQASEMGTIHSPKELSTLSNVCRENGLRLHMDGARFANALVEQSWTPAEMSWKAGVDILSFGATKNGALGCEAVIIFDPALADEFAFKRKRTGHLFSKMRLLAAQMSAYLENDLWLNNARHANAMAQRLYKGLKEIPGVDFPYPVEANMLFPRLPDGMAQELKTQGFVFYDNRWDPGICRLVTAFNTKKSAVDQFISAASSFSSSKRG